jgi:hypothetical protein
MSPDQSALGLSWDRITQLLLILLELSCAAILITRHVMDKLAARNGKSPEPLEPQEGSQPVSLPILLAVVAYAVTRILYIFVIYPLGGDYIWGDPMVFVSAVSNFKPHRCR